MSEQPDNVEPSFLPARLIEQVAAERFRQEVKFPEQHLINGPVVAGSFVLSTNVIRKIVDELPALGRLTWADVLAEEVSEAFDEARHPGNEAELRTELIQVAAVALRWIEDIDRQALACTSTPPETER